MFEIKLFCSGVQLFNNYTLCDLDSFDAILRNTFLDTYEIDILHNGNNVRVHVTKESKLPNFVILMSLGVSNGGFKLKRARQPPKCILDSLNKILKMLTYKLFSFLPPYKKVDKIEVVFGLALPSKSPYKWNQKNLEELKKKLNDLFNGGYIQQSKASHIMGHWFCLSIERR